MGKIDLQSNEVIVRETRGVTVRSIPMDAILTTRRVILSDRRTDAPMQKSIPLVSIREIRLEEDTSSDPAVILSIMTESGSIRQMIIIFPPFEGIRRDTECRDWVQSLKERTASAREIAHVSTPTPVKTDTGVKPGILSVEEPVIPPKTRDWVPEITPYVPKNQPEPVGPPKRSRFIKIGAIILAIVVIIAILMFAGQLMKGTTSSPQTPQTISPLTTTVTPIPTPTPEPTPEFLPTTTVTTHSTAPPKYIIPDKGVWVRLQYPGNYIGYIGAKGLQKQINSTGEQYLQLPIVSGNIDGSIEKQDGSTDNLIVEIYQDGALISQESTRTPYGILDIHTSL